MRSVPLGLLADRAQLAAAARAQAAVTHDTAEGMLSSHVVALMAHALLHERADPADLPRLVERETGFAPRSDWCTEVECDAIQTLHAVNTALQRHRSVQALLRGCVDFGGDVDSVAAIALGLASLSPAYDADIPQPLVQGLEDGGHGLRFLAALDAQLAASFPVLARCLQHPLNGGGA
jgi:ADP-ribosylglycohydrolase